MGIITAEIRGDSQEWVSIGYTWPERAFWVPREENIISYAWADANNWMVPPWLSKPPEIGDSYQGEELPDSVYQGEGSFSSYSLVPGNIDTVAGLIPQATIDRFEGSGKELENSSVTIETRELVGAIHRDEWYSYTGLYLMYSTHIQPFVKMTKARHYFRLRIKTCSNKNVLPEGVLVLREDCGKPLPPIAFSGNRGGGGGSGGGIRNRRRRKNKLNQIQIRKDRMCCDCATIADLLDRQNEQIKQFFETQNREIGDGLTEQTKFLKEQMIALTPKGFDYKPILDGQQDVKHDVINALWNGVPFNLE